MFELILIDLMFHFYILGLIFFVGLLFYAVHKWSEKREKNI